MDFETANGLSERYAAVSYDAEHQQPKVTNPENLSPLQRFESLADRVMALPDCTEESSDITKVILFGDPLLHHLTLRVDLTPADGTPWSIVALWDSSEDLQIEEYMDLEEIQAEADETTAEDINRRLGLIEESVTAAEGYLITSQELDESVVTGEVDMSSNELRDHHIRLSSNDAIREALAQGAYTPGALGLDRDTLHIRDASGNMREVEFVDDELSPEQRVFGTEFATMDRVPDEDIIRKRKEAIERGETTWLPMGEHFLTYEPYARLYKNRQHIATLTVLDKADRSCNVAVIPKQEFGYNSIDFSWEHLVDPIDFLSLTDAITMAEEFADSL